MTLISLIIPAKNEEGNIRRLFEQVTSVCTLLAEFDFEVIVVDNDSDDNTGLLVESICAKTPNWRYLKFTRDFGSEASIAAGLRFCRGDAAVVLFSDLQDPPELIPKLVDKWREGYDIVFGVYSGTSHDKLLKRILINFYYRILSRVADVPMIPHAGDFRLYSRRVVNTLNRLTERNRYMRGLAQWVGYRSYGIDYQRQPRKAGKSKAPYGYMFRFAFSVIVNFSDVPLKLFTTLGLWTFLLGSMGCLALVANYFFRPIMPGLSTTHVLLTFILSFLGLGFGTLGEYIAKIYREVKQRPLYIVDRAVGLDIVGKELG
jgi:polyisoprenyl-phosphate glycosyltransferase